MKVSQYIERIKTKDLDEQLHLVSCLDDITQERNRYLTLLNEFYEQFGDQDVIVVSAPGRTEVGGNHTDHQLGRVLAASVNMDIIAVVGKNDRNEVTYQSKGFACKPVSLASLDIQQDEKFTSEGLIRGIASRFSQLGYQIGGFDALSTSNVLQGSGISSSAAFEVLIGTILNHLYNDGTIDSSTIAKIGQYAENNYFMKPCGLLDQMACATGGFVMIDFKDRENPVVEPIHFDFSKSGLHLCLVDTKGSHADLSDEYGKMPSEMKSVANALGKEVLSQESKEELLNSLSLLHEKCCDRAILRAFHFVNETSRALDEATTLKNNDLKQFMSLIIESGYSSYMYLQNVINMHDLQHQNLALALCISEQLLKQKGAYRVHGGGLAGTIQAFVPHNLIETYVKHMEDIYGKGCCFILSIRPVGGYCFQ